MAYGSADNTKLSPSTQQAYYEAPKATYVDPEQQQYGTTPASHPVVQRNRHFKLILRLVIMALVAAVVITAFIFGIENIHTTCNHPLAAWLIVDASVKLSQLILVAVYTVVTHFRTHVSTLAVLGEEEPVKAKTPMWFNVVNGLYLLFYVVWILGIGSWWVFTAKNADQCDTSLYEKARGVLITVYIILGVVLLMKLRGLCKRKQTA